MVITSCHFFCRKHKFIHVYETGLSLCHVLTGFSEQMHTQNPYKKGNHIY